jgi:hypothetical protein
MAWKPDYIDLATAKAFLRITDTVDDAELATLLTAASRAVDDRTNRQFGQLSGPAARVYRRPPAYDLTSGLWLVEIDDLQDVTGMTVGGVAYASQTGVLGPDNAPADMLPWTRLGFATIPTMPLTVVARWGWTAVPAGVITAVKFVLNRWNKRRESPFGVAGSPDTGSELRLLAKLDADAVMALKGLGRRRRVG